MTDNERASDLHQQAQDCEDDEQALALYHQALSLDPDRPATLYNIGLIHKYRGDWSASREFNQRSVSLRPDDEASNWNLAIAATALCDWSTARSCWRRLGIEVGDDEGPIEVDFGLTPVRLNPDADAEVVWSRRIDLVRARITNIPYPGSGFRFGDVVLHDGAAVGSRVWQEREYPVFNVLELHSPSVWTTYELILECRGAEHIEELTQLLDAEGCKAEDWGSSVRILCKACSEGRPHEHHDEDLVVKGWENRRTLGLACTDPLAAQRAISRWVGPGRRVISLDARLAPPLV
jgi:tetratricopeptide (TPR) repeat protein